MTADLPLAFYMSWLSAVSFLSLLSTTYSYLHKCWIYCGCNFLWAGVLMQLITCTGLETAIFNSLLVTGETRGDVWKQGCWSGCCMGGKSTDYVLPLQMYIVSMKETLLLIILPTTSLHCRWRRKLYWRVLFFQFHPRASPACWLNGVRLCFQLSWEVLVSSSVLSSSLGLTEQFL